MATDAGQLFASFAGKAGTALTVLKWISIGIGLIAVIGGIIFWKIQKKRYIYKIEVWGSDGGIPDMLIADTARPVKIRTKEGISSLLYLKKLKRYIKNPPRDFFRNNRVRFWFRKDGELTPIRIKKPLFLKLLEARPFQKEEDNAKLSDDAEYFVPYVLEDVNERFEVSNVEFINEDMRLAHVSTGKIIRDMFNINKFFKEHGATILMILGVMIMGIVLILILDGARDYYASAGSVSSEAGKVSDNLRNLNEAMLQTLQELQKTNKGGGVPIQASIPIINNSTPQDG